MISCGRYPLLLQVLDLSYNQLGPEGAAVVARFMCTAPRLVRFFPLTAAAGGAPGTIETHAARRQRRGCGADLH